MLSNSARESNMGGSAPYMNTLTSCVNTVVKDGYTDNFKVTQEGLFSYTREKNYRLKKYVSSTFIALKGNRTRPDNAILYVIETNDGSKGTIIDAYGPSSDAKLTAFMSEVEAIGKKEKKNPEC